MRFLVRIRGARTPPPRMDEPVTKIPLRSCTNQPMSPKPVRMEGNKCTHHPAPRTLSPMQRPMPVDAHMYGLDSSRNRPTLNASPEPARRLRIVLTKKGAIARTGKEKIKCDEYRKKSWETECVVEEEVTHVVAVWRAVALAESVTRAHP
jgi:hypothetical protein